MDGRLYEWMGRLRRLLESSFCVFASCHGPDAKMTFIQVFKDLFFIIYILLTGL